MAGSLIDTERGNSDIGPEQQEEIEAGLDLGFLKGRLGFDFTYYRRNTTDLLLFANVPASSGFSTQIVNAADLKNEGLEIGLDAQIFNKTNLNWNVGVNFWLNRSKLTKLNVPAFPLGAFGEGLGSYKLEEGKSVTQIVGTVGMIQAKQKHLEMPNRISKCP